jgi:uncharacterized membrane protein YedE/YeeE
MKLVVYFVVGSIFSAGLIISGMTQPIKVIGFLDVFGNWDPSLAFVMGSAVTVTLFGYKIVFISDKPIYEREFNLPIKKPIDVHLVLGAMCFGLGWGLSGLCPGPAIASLVTGSIELAAFVGAMFSGFYASSVLSKN